MRIHPTIESNNLIVTKLDYQRPIFKNADNPIDFNLFRNLA